MGALPLTMFVGTDIENISRLENLLVRKPQLVKKIFYESEWVYAFSKASPASTLTGIWCAKEAVLKALSPQIEVAITDIEIVKHAKGYPLPVVHHPFFDHSNYAISVSISHTREVAMASAVLYIGSLVRN